MDGLNPKTAELIDRFAAALKEKARSAELKYGFSDDWARDDWQSNLRKSIRVHLEKGDPRDVAIYAAFAWHHGWSVSPDVEGNPWRDFRSYSTISRIVAEFKWTDGQTAIGQWSAAGHWMRHQGDLIRPITFKRKFEEVSSVVKTTILSDAPPNVFPTHWRPLEADSTP